MISKFLGGNFNQTKVQESLARLKAIEEGIVSADALYLCPTIASANYFIRAVKDLNVDIDSQKVVSERLSKSKTFGPRTIYESLMAYHPISVPNTKIDWKSSDFCERNLRDCTAGMNKASRALSKFEGGLGCVTLLGGRTTIEDISPEALQAYDRAVKKLAKALEKTSQLISKRLKEEKLEEHKFLF